MLANLPSTTSMRAGRLRPSGLRRRRRVAIAGLISAAAHLGVLALMITSAAGAVISGGAAQGGGGAPLTVTVVSASSLGLHGEAGGSTSGYFKARRAIADVNPLPASDHPGESSMDRLLKSVRAQGGGGDRPASSTPTAPSPRIARSAGPEMDLLAQPRSGPNAPTSGAASSGDLWGRIEPCWRRLPIPARIPVSLEITLDGNGAMGQPPKVLRDPGRPIEEARLRAEERALAALAECLPRNAHRTAAGVYRLNFGVDG